MPAMPAPLVVSDMDGTLATVDTWRGVHAWIRACYPSRDADRFVRVRLPAIVKARVFGIDKEGFRARWQEDQARLLEGMDAARLDELATSVVEEHLWPSRRQVAVDAVHAAIETARGADPAARLVLATGGWQPLGDAFAKRLGADLALGTPLEVRDGIVTGRTVVPTQSGAQKAAAVRALAAGSPIVAAFGDTAADVALLELAERPVAVAPDRELRLEAVRRGWEILES
jgi:phosphoserine phosphatase